jgi:hypothetical protein
MNHHSQRILPAALVVIASSFFWPLQAFSATAPAKYIVGYATYTARIMPLWLAQEQGFFIKYGIDVDPVFIRGASLEGMRNVQRLLKSRNPKVGEVKADDVIDNRLMRKLDETGFIDKMYATYGAKL